MNKQNTVVPFRLNSEDAAPSPFENIWGKKVQSHGYAAIPSIMIRSQRRLGVNTTQFCILVQLLEYLRSPDRAPFPTKQQLADRIGIKAATIKANMQTLEKAGLIERVQRKTPAGDWGANTYHLDGLITKIKALEPDFAKEREEKEQARKKAETPRGRRTRN
jgi:DNA-binding HxlR family transcriptional regulator